MRNYVDCCPKILVFWYFLDVGNCHLLHNLTCDFGIGSDKKPVMKSV